MKTNTTQRSAKTYTTALNTQILEGDTPTPDAILMALEAMFLGRKGPQELADPARVYTPTHELSARETALLGRHLSRWVKGALGVKWLPKGFTEQVAAACLEVREDQGWITLEDILAATSTVVERFKSLDAWKQEQRKVRKASRHDRTLDTRKGLINGKRLWIDAEVNELPPLAAPSRVMMSPEGVTKTVKPEAVPHLVAEGWALVSEVTTGVSHEPARYAIRLPDGRLVDLGQQQGQFAPVLRTNPAQAMQSIAARLGITMRGGDVEILRAITGLEDVVPAYTTVRQNNAWLVIVGWMANPTTTPTRFWDLNGELTEQPVPGQEPLTHSEMAYHLISQPSIERIGDDEEEDPSYVDVEEDFEKPMVILEEEPAIDNYLLREAVAHLGLAVEQLNGSAVWTHPELRNAIALSGAEVRKQRRHASVMIKIMAERKNQLIAEIIATGGDSAMRAEVNQLAKRITRAKARRSALFHQFREELADLESQLEVSSETLVPRRNPMLATPSGQPAPLRPTCPQMFTLPANEIETTQVKVANAKPQGSIGDFHRLRQGTSSAVIRDGALVTFTVGENKAPQRITARNASPQLKAVLRGMIRAQYEEA